MAVAVTFIPAALAILGDRVFWPSRPGREVSPARGAEEREGRPLRSRVLRAASARPLITALACVALLLAAASGLLHLRVGQTLIRGLPWGSETHQAYVQASQGFASGVLSPTTILVESPGIVGRRTALFGSRSGTSAQLPGVALVVGPAQQPLGARPRRRVLAHSRRRPLPRSSSTPIRSAPRRSRRLRGCAHGCRRSARAGGVAGRTCQHRRRHGAGRGDGPPDRRRTSERSRRVALLAVFVRPGDLPARAGRTPVPRGGERAGAGGVARARPSTCSRTCWATGS